MHASFPKIVLATLATTSGVLAQYDPNLVGTWSTKSKAVLTGPSFYNPVTDRLIEPELTGISYSFTIDGHYEESYYRAIPNPTQPACPSGIMQWQHGTYSLPGNGSLLLQPFAVDGRQLMSSPCSYDESIYTRYDQPELILSYQTLLDPYHNVQRLNLYRFNGSPQIPMYLVYNPPEMLPTQTLNPTATASATSKAKRDASNEEVRAVGKDGSKGVKKQKPSIKDAILNPTDPFNPDRWWWVGVGLTAVGTVMYMMPTST